LEAPHKEIIDVYPAGIGVDVVVRCMNEMPYTRRTLESLKQQLPPLNKIVFVDSGSTDGSRECASEFGCEIIDIKPEEYIPGRVINSGMAATSSQVVAFVNADAIPLDSSAVERLVAPFRSRTQVAATFGRQVARPDAEPLTVYDMERAFSAEGTVATKRGSFFSMAASAISRSVWQQHSFSETLRYSEDVDWTHRVAQAGWEVLYMPEARFEHSHDYTLEASRRRRRGEGEADTHIFRLGPPSLVQDLIRPLCGSLLRDAQAGNLSRTNVLIRWNQAVGYFDGRKVSS